jgi:transcriptional regulator with XRE-family HTH domain
MSDTNVNSKRGSQADLARRMGMSRQAVHEILSRKRTPGYKLSVKLEQATGVPRLSWMDPDTYPNPLIKKSADGNGTRTDPA